MRIEVCFTPRDYRELELPVHTAVVIDVLRATSSIATALYNGCEQLLPVETVEEARELRTEKYTDALLAGEREAILIPGFDLGNSPFDYDKPKVHGRTIIMTTTNGTSALHAASRAETVYTASFVNAGAVCEAVGGISDLVIVCAGTKGRFSVEDTLCAGLLADRLSDGAVLGDTALAAQAMYRYFAKDITSRVKQSSHAAKLIRLGFEKDIEYCLQTDVIPLTPLYKYGLIMKAQKNVL